MKDFIRSLMVSGWFVIVRFAGRLVGSPLIGGTFARLSLGAALAPLAGFYGGSVGALGSAFFVLAISTYFHGSLSLASLVLYLPGVIGGLFLAVPSRWAKGLFFLAAMLIFWVHPLGQQAFLYPLLWVLPLGLVLFDSSSLCARALVSSFAVHAVGACWWLYTMPMSSILWHGMIPLVMVERLVQALLMVVVIKAVEKVKKVAVISQVAVSLSSQ